VFICLYFFKIYQFIYFKFFFRDYLENRTYCILLLRILISYNWDIWPTDIVAAIYITQFFTVNENMFYSNEIPLVDWLNFYIILIRQLFLSRNYRENIKNLFSHYMRSLINIESNRSFHNTWEINFFLLFNIIQFVFQIKPLRILTADYRFKFIIFKIKGIIICKFLSLWFEWKIWVNLYFK